MLTGAPCLQWTNAPLLLRLANGNGKRQSVVVDSMHNSTVSGGQQVASNAMGLVGRLLQSVTHSKVGTAVGKLGNPAVSPGGKAHAYGGRLSAA